MRVMTDLHIHSKYSRACSKDISIPNLAKYSLMKGITLLGTGDCQHPKWLEELQRDLTDDHGNGVYTAHGQNFICTTEISLAYTDKGKGRRIHHVVLLPSLQAAKQFQSALLKHGRVDYDGRPIFGMTSAAFVELVRDISTDAEVIPAHAWTPYFGLFGSKSGYTCLSDCFDDTTKYIHAIETGLSSDPAMNWRLSQLSDRHIVSFSDSHSHWPWRIGRECTEFELSEITYKNLITALRTKLGPTRTIEFFPEQGKYHLDGHANCGVSFLPSQSKARANICPTCHKQLTIGVLNRTEELADQPEGYTAPNAKPYTKLVPLSELIAVSIGKGVATPPVWEIYMKLIARFGTEFTAALDASEQDLINTVGNNIASLIMQNRAQQIQFNAGYDGQYGVPLLKGVVAPKKTASQKITPPPAQRKVASVSGQKELGEF